MDIINLSDFTLEDRHIQLLHRGISLSPANRMNQFEVYKDISLFLQKVYLRLIHQVPGLEEGGAPMVTLRTNRQKKT